MQYFIWKSGNKNKVYISEHTQYFDLLKCVPGTLLCFNCKIMKQKNFCRRGGLFMQCKGSPTYADFGT